MALAQKHARETGFSYIGLLIIVAIIGVASAATLTAGSAMQRRSAEEELLFIGGQFQDAFKTYYEATPHGMRPYPEKLDDLLLDRRAANPRRHLRKIFADPLTGRFEWGLAELPGGGITGIYSLATEPPIRNSGFESRFSGLENRTSYRNWIFSYSPLQIAKAAQVH